MYLFLASAKIPQRFSSRRRLLLYHTRNKKDTASILCRVQRMPSMASAEHEFACCKLTALTGCQWFHAVSSFSQGKTRSNQMYMDVHLVAMPSMAVLNAYLRVHGSTSSLPRKFEVKEYPGRTFFNDDIHSGRKMVGIPPSHE